MGLEQPKCYYHPDRPAVEKCESCNRLICLEDKMIYRRYGGIDQADDVYTLCPVCYEKRKAAARNVGMLCTVLAIIIFSIVVVFFLLALEVFPGIF
ncbi:MAG: hypothetical protein ACFFGZ_10220 [Candidatus Thorarchaeota archaeon]